MVLCTEVIGNLLNSLVTGHASGGVGIEGMNEAIPVSGFSGFGLSVQFSGRNEGFIDGALTVCKAKEVGYGFEEETVRANQISRKDDRNSELVIIDRLDGQLVMEE
jgi:hypothetical protein